MKIIALVENRSDCELKPRHGLSLYVETKNHKLLFDLGPDDTLFDNAKMRNIDLSDIDTVVISHGHSDHGGALARFLKENAKAKTYIQRRAFERHYSRFLFLKADIGLDRQLKNHPQVILLDGDAEIDQELSLFVVNRIEKCCSSANDSFYEGGQKDVFLHEQNLMIREEQTAVLIGCGHIGVVNIMEKAQSFAPQICVGGFHLFNPPTRKTADKRFLDEIAENLKKYPQVRFFTCHCTGKKAYDYLASKLPNLHYLSCGNVIE